MVLFLWLLALTNAVASAPNIGLLINSQVPPVARVSKTFQFVFAESTFTSAAKSIDYALSGSPPWLNLDSASRTLSGTAPAEAAGPVFLRLVASDETGSTAMEVTLIVSADPGPGLGTSVSDQLAAQGAFSAPDNVMIARSGPLSLSFSRSTFTNTNEKTVYYAISANNTPLPSWITFDPTNLSLTGTAPQSTSPSELPQSYGIQLTASDVVGFSGAVARFQIIVGGHLLSFGKSLEIINATQGVPFNFSGLGTALVLDDRPVKPTDLGQVVADIPEWMSLDNSTLMISGTPPSSATSQNFTVTVTDIYGDTASAMLLVQLLNSSSNLFRGTIGILNATSGSDFDSTIDRSLLASPDVVVAVDLEKSAPWLKFDASSLRLSGLVPKDIEDQKLLLNITASLGSQSESQVITIDIGRKNEGEGGKSDKPNRTTSSVAAPSSNKSSETFPAASVATSKHRRKWLPAVILLPMAMALAALVVICVYKRKRRRRQSFDESPRLEKEEISRPMEQEASWLTIREDETVGKPGATQKGESSKPPKLEIKDLWSSSPIKRGSRSRWSRMAGEESNLSHNTDIFQEYVGRNFNAVRPEPAAVQDFNRRAEEYSLSRPQTKRRSERSRRSAMSTHSSISEIIPSCRYPKPGKNDLRLSLLGAKLSSGQPIPGLGRADISMGHGVDIMDRGAIHSRAHSDMVLYARLSQPPFGGIGGPHDFGLVKTTWRNVGARGYDTTEYATTDSSSLGHDGKHTEVSWIMRNFPQTPTSNTLQIGPPNPAKGSHRRGKYPQTETVRMIAPSPAASLRREPTLQNFHKQRISSRQRINPLFSAGPTPRASSLSLWKVSRKSARLSRNQSINSQTSETQGLSSPDQHHHRSRLENSNYSPSRSSLLSQSQSPQRRHRPPHRRHRFSTFGNFLHTRHRSSISMTSSQRYATPDHSDHGGEEEEEEFRSESYYDMGHEDIEEGIDEDGHRLWRPVERFSPATAARQHGPENPYRGADIFTSEWSSSARDASGNDDVGDIMDYETQKQHTNSNINKDDDDGGGGETATNSFPKSPNLASRKRLLVGGARGKRPVSVDVQGGLGKGWSMRGDLRGDSREGSAFL